MCFLVVSVLPLPDLVLFKLLFLVLSLCLYGEDVARGGLSGSLQSEVEMSDRTEKLFVSSRVEFEKSELAKLGMPHWQQIHETRLVWRALCAIVDIPSGRSMSLAGSTLLLFFTDVTEEFRLVWTRVRVKVTSLHTNLDGKACWMFLV